MIPNFHIIGIQGSGKGVQSSLLVKQFGFNYLASGNIFRERSKIDDEIGRKILAEMIAGKLLPTSQLVSTIRYYLDNNKVELALLGDGVIRTMEQSEALEPIWTEYNIDQPILINLVLSSDEAIKRIEKRKVQILDPSLSDYHKVYGGKLAHRLDDNPAAIQERFRLFHERTEPVINKYKKMGRCYSFDSSKSIEEINSEICKTITTLFPKIKERNGIN